MRTMKRADEQGDRGAPRTEGAVRRIDRRASATTRTGMAYRLAVAAGALLLAALPAHRARARAGDLDPTFGNGGIVILPNLRAEAPFDTATAVAIQPDGKIVVAGRWGATSPGPTFAIVRLKADGSLDDGFGFEGLVSLSSGYAGGDEAHSVAIAGDGKILVGGYFGMHGGVYRLDPDGTLDSAFGSAGAVVIGANGDYDHRTTLNDLVIDGSGGTLFAGDYYGSGHGEYMLGWLGSDGTILTAAPVGLGIGDRDQIATSLIRQPDDKVVVAGYADLTDVPGYERIVCAVARFVPTVFPSLGFTPDAGYGNGPATLFSIGGTSPTTSCYADTIALMQDGSTLAAGREPLDAGGWLGLYARLDSGGQLGSDFIDTPVFSAWGDNSVRSIALQADGKPVLVGYTGVDESGVPGPFAARLAADGFGFDPDYGDDGETLIDFDANDFASGQALGAAIDAEGRVVVVGIYFNGNSGEGGEDVSQIFVTRLQGDTSDSIFADGFDG
jgi:uncharacterized delta-60 repeat protein